MIVRWLNTLAININGHIKAYRLDPDSKRHAPIFHFFEDWKFYDDGDNHRLLRDESQLPDGFYEGLEDRDLVSGDDYALLGIDQIIWGRPVEINEPPQPTKLKQAEKKRAYLRERGLSDLKRVLHTNRERLHFIEDQTRMFEAETTFIQNCSRNGVNRTPTCLNSPISPISHLPPPAVCVPTALYWYEETLIT